MHSATHNVYIVITITAASNGVEKSFIRMFDDHTFDGAKKEEEEDDRERERESMLILCV